jgi:hypothetical protein
VEVGGINAGGEGGFIVSRHVILSESERDES